MEKGKISIFSNGQRIAEGISELNLTPSTEPIPDESEPWNDVGGPFSISGVLTTDAEVTKMMRKIFDSCFFSRKEVKQLFYDITHGYDILFKVTIEKKDGSVCDDCVIVRCPRHLRQFFALTKHVKCEYLLRQKE